MSARSRSKRRRLIAPISLPASMPDTVALLTPRKAAIRAWDHPLSSRKSLKTFPNFGALGNCMTWASCQKCLNVSRGLSLLFQNNCGKVGNMTVKPQEMTKEALENWLRDTFEKLEARQRRSVLGTTTGCAA